MSPKQNALKTDRLKLSGTSNSPEETQTIFKDIQEKTGVKIQWELNKFSEIFKRDPVIRLCGTPEAVKVARHLVLQHLEIQSNRIILKMDVTHEEHPSLIGKKGALIKKVMEVTNTHIHFPDINKVSGSEKSNQVSITGEPSNCERARIMVRALLPFQILFDVDRSNIKFLNAASIFWRELEKNLGLAVSFISNKTSVTTIIRCSQGHFKDIQTKQLILSLIEFLSGKKGSELPTLRVVIDIMKQHQHFVKGNRGSNLQAISEKTGAKIVFPNMNSEASQGRLVTIFGNLDCVYMAWQEIMSSLPLCAVFDVSENRNTKNESTFLLQDCNITTYSREKPRYHIKSITAKGPEKFSKLILQYRQNVLNFPPINFGPDSEDIKRALNFQANFLPIIDNIHALFSSFSLTSSLQDGLMNFLNVASNSFLRVDPQFLQVPAMYNSAIHPTFLTSGERISYCEVKQAGPNNAEVCYTPSTSQCPRQSYASSILSDWKEISNNNNNCEGIVLSCHGKASSSHRPSTDDQISWVESPTLKKKGLNNSEVFEKRLSAYQAIHRNIESPQVPNSLWAGYGFSQSMPATTFSKDSETSSQYSSISLESNCSSSSDETWDKVVLADYIDDKIWSNREGSVFSMSNLFDFKRNTSLPSTNFPYEDILPRLLYEEGLFSYLDIFLKEEIDYATFLLLNDEDLTQLGISYPARMKIICLIRELQDAEMKLKTFDAAPGAGRRVAEFAQ